AAAGGHSASDAGAATGGPSASDAGAATGGESDADAANDAGSSAEPPNDGGTPPDASLDAATDAGAAPEAGQGVDAAEPDQDAAAPPVIGGWALSLCCAGDGDCGPDAVCVEGACFAETAACTDDTTCEDGDECDLDVGHCRSPGCGCVSDGDCGPDALCVDTPEQCGMCLPRSSLCGQQCVRPEGYWTFRHLPAADRESLEVEGAVTELTEDTVVVSPAGGGSVTFGYALPSREEAPYELPLALGEQVSVEVLFAANPSGIGDANVTIRDEHGRLVFAAARAFQAPVSVGGVTVEAVDVGCSNGDVGDCIQTRYAMALITDGRGVQSAANADERTVVVEDGRLATLVLVSAEIDENACQPAEEHGPILSVMLLPH
ncbi:MAG: hypothetical protein JW940_35860, partial [Polyangiaceae bacterium]|nr:hypothetical protein [Polyangiaceae bacterium]